MRYQVLIIGGGLAGLLNSILLARAGFKVTLVEKKSYPFHKVCGEYISHEVSPFLKNQGLYPNHLNPINISRLILSAQNGQASTMELPLGGFGISRYHLDHYWFEEASRSGVHLITSVSVGKVDFVGDYFQVHLSDGQEFETELVIGAYGKRAALDKALQRPFIGQRSPYVGVKYHARLDWASTDIALHNFSGGYCGISAVSSDIVNICYLTRRENIKKHGAIATMEEKVLKTNPYLREIFDRSKFLFDQPLVINEVSFSKKSPVENHILMSGDAAGLITPLCGNGMAMAIRSALLLSNCINNYFKQTQKRHQLEAHYKKEWLAQFSYRLAVGRSLQQLFEKNLAMNLLVRLARSPIVGKAIVKQTHGDVFEA